MSDALRLDLMSFPLHGTQLIEASAGTGKTFTIAALYLRLILGLNSGQSPLGPDQILVVTFTEAATEELRDRVRQRVSDAREAFLVGHSKDPFLQALLQATSDVPRAITLLEAALRQMDEAAVFTIHGFCQRMLRQHAFESGSLFSQELLTDNQSLIRAALLDLWRDLLYPLPGLVADQLLELWPTPDSLYQAVSSYVGRFGVQLQPDLGDADLVQLVEQRTVLIKHFKSAWLSQAESLEGLINNSGLNKQSYRVSSVANWLSQVTDYAMSEQREPDKSLLKVMDRFTPATLAAKTKTGAVPEHPLFDLTQRLVEETVPLREAVLSRTLAQLELRMQAEKQQHQLLTFDDLLSGLHSALSGDGGGRLSAAIRQQFPVALIDEFQDTDPLQYGIFKHVYQSGTGTAWVMIGDPKQAIYAFRGADIFTYMQAKSGVEQPYTLGTNWRSTAAMVAAVNAVFQHVSAPFIYTEQIPYQSVTAAGKDKQLRCNGELLPALTFWHDPDVEALNKQQYRSKFADIAARQIFHLLSSDSQIGDVALCGGDIAVLVRDRYEAESISQALQALALPSVYLSGRDSVFATQEAADLSLVLAAVANPQDETCIRAALACSLMLLDLAALDRLNRDEQAWDAVLKEFDEYHQLWQRHGVLPMLNQLLQRRDLAAGLLALPQGERRLTNLMQLSELLQQRSVELDTSTALLRWFYAQQQGNHGQSDEQILRLESDRKRITIITIHKAKGLEFPVVFLPFICSAGKAKDALYHTETGAAVLDLSQGKENLVLADKERLAEDLRLLYVALTRSIYACYLGVAEPKPYKGHTFTNTALGYLLQQLDGNVAQALQKLVQHCPSIAVQTTTHVSARTSDWQQPVVEETLAARRFSGSIPTKWRVTSYSALSRRQHSLPELPGIDLEVADEKPQQPEIDPDGHSIFTFPKGATAGTCLHALFEKISFAQFDAQQDASTLAQELELSGYAAEWLPVVTQLVADTLACPLDGEQMRLGLLDDADRRVELEFMFPVEGVQSTELERVVRQHDSLSAQAAHGLEFEQVDGMLKGFIDLLFRYNGRYYVLDYKSNHLGNNLDCYAQHALEYAMLEHRYDLQYQLYSLALHRLLQTRLPHYDYNQHFGGVYYLFLRGVTPQGGSGVFSCRPSLALLTALDHLFAGGGVV
ncbi:exodeoxyribonuclease V subunit beta [Pontibacter sp. JAM-7]|uniref:exodeoxyribonuclease V subunit beta n=1 Tax=Pontibacter sp. JAM-7 TaxID=3366581 RepID=UPI003AF7AFF8